MKKYVIPMEGIEGYGSHIPFLLKELELAPDNIMVLEFGCGAFSTYTFLNCDKVVHVDSMEMQSELWLDKMRSAVDDDRCMIWDATDKPETALDFARHLLVANKYHIAFVDGHADNRPECVNLCLEANIPVIMIHDYQCDVYGWERIDMDLAYWNGYDMFKYITEDNQITLCLKIKAA